jgi:hypothetical protein
MRLPVRDAVFSITANLEIESITIHPQLRGIETIKQKNNEHRIKSRPD